MKRWFSFILLCVLVLSGCEATDITAQENAIEEQRNDNETIQTSLSETVMDDSVNMTGNEETSREANDFQTAESLSDQYMFFLSNYPDFSLSLDEYDYVCLLKGIYIPCDGSAGKLYVDPIEFVWNYETERWAEWGHKADEGPYYDWKNSEEETAELELSESAEFHYWVSGDRHDTYPYIAAEAVKDGECITQCPEIFCAWIRDDFGGNNTGDYPFFLILDQDGKVKYVIAPFLV